MALDKKTLEARKRLRKKHKKYIAMNEEKKEDLKKMPIILRQQANMVKERKALKEKKKADKLKSFNVRVKARGDCGCNI